MKRLVPEKPGDPTYRQVWRIVDGAVAAALAAHPEYLAPGARVRTVRNSIVKRVTGAIHGYAEQSAWVRSGSSPADETAECPDLGLRRGTLAGDPDAASMKRREAGRGLVLPAALIE